MNLDDPSDRAVAAGEYVLGTLDAGERAQFERAATRAAAVRRDQYGWEQRFARLGLGLEPVSPRPVVWVGLHHRIATQSDTRGGTGMVMSLPRRSRAVTAWAALSTAASLLLAVALLVERQRPAPTPEVVTRTVEVPVPTVSYVAWLQVPQSSMHWTVSVAPKQGQLAVRAGGEVPAAAAGLDAELWLITDSGPVSLGVIPKTGELHRPLPKGVGEVSGRTLAVSLEPKGGSPTGQPTGPVVTSGVVLQAS